MGSTKEVVVLKTGDCSAKIHLFGATVVSWICNGRENLFMSSLSKLDGSKSIRGGIPIVFPNFGPWKLGPQHGFARSQWWKVNSQPQQLENGDVQAVFELVDNEQTRLIWNYKFRLLYKVVLSVNKLKTDLTVTNIGEEEFDFTTLLHTYFKLNDISTCKLTGFAGCHFLDKVVNSNEDEIETRKEIEIDRNVDNIYKDTKSHSVITEDSKITLQKNNLPDTVLWNPWIEKAKNMSDFQDDGYLTMVCVEAGYVTKRKLLKPKEDFVCSQTLTYN